MRHNRYDDGFGKWPVILMGLLVLALLLYAFQVEAQAIPRYLVIRQAFVFERGSELPYEAVRPMRFDDSLGYVDVPIVNAYRLYVLVDLQTKHYAEVMASDSGCFVLWMLPELGSDGQPHVDSGEWILCDDTTS